MIKNDFYYIYISYFWRLVCLGKNSWNGHGEGKI